MTNHKTYDGQLFGALEHAVKKRDWQKVRAVAGTALARKELSPVQRTELLAYRALSHMWQNRLSLSIGDARRALRLDDKNLYAKAVLAQSLIKIGWLQLDLDSCQEAKRLCRQILKTAPRPETLTNSPFVNDTLYTLAFAEKNLGNTSRAAALLRMHVNARAAGALSMYDLRDTRYKLRAWENANVILPCRVPAQDEVDRLFHNVDRAERQGAWRDMQLAATSLLRTLPATSGHRGTVLSHRAFAYLRQQQLEHALKDARAAAKLRPGDAHVSLVLAIVLVECGCATNNNAAFAEAKGLCEKYIALGVTGIMRNGQLSNRSARKNLNEAHYTLALAEWNLNNSRNAIRHMRHYLANRSRYGSNYSLSYARRALSDWEGQANHRAQSRNKGGPES